MALLHVRYNGQSHDVELAEVDLGDLSNDQQVRAAAARYVEQPIEKFAAFSVDRNTDTGDITLRPQAIFG